MSLMANESNRRSQRHSRGTKDVERDFLASYEPDIDDPPPSSIIQQHRSRRDSRRPTMTEDILAPLPIFKDPRISHPWAPSRGEVPNISGASRDNIYLRLDTGARRTLPPLTESSHADSLLGRIFTRTTESQPTDQVLVSSAGDELPASMNEEGRALLSRATRQILGQYYEFGVSADEVSPRTQYRYQHTPGPSAVQIIDSVQSQSQSLHRRESAHHPSYLAHSPSQPPAPLNRRRGGLRRPRELDAPVTPSSSPAHPLGQNSRDHYTSHNSASGRRSSSLNPNTLAHAHSSSDVMINDDPRGQNKQPRDSSAARRNPVNESSRRHSGVAPHTVDIAMDVPELQNLSRYPTSLHTSYTPTMPAQLVHDPRLHRFRQNDGSNLTPEALHGSPSRQ
ncbi:hypothetical protein FPV67DRAFT_1019722 [Lyophyllum atratum]|nr:hypothetical protein FPV67DRAFT_1019722 [Lyophyllum atratum]